MRIDPIELATAVREVAKEQPAQWNRQARYFDHEGQPMCIVGHALSHMGFGPDTIEEDGLSVDRIIERRSWDPESEEARWWLMRVQINADRGGHKSSLIARYDDGGCPVYEYARAYPDLVWDKAIDRADRDLLRDDLYRY
ncbi:hypothetical protein HOT82_gp069 [Gordonia phage Ronaldo]|uniref:Uncharacterized protein n=3 Tax=Ronaldovirus ronaldo TaxID=2734270 RepID=A0A6B9LGI6_9CAUD|nr:hypothetical protein HOT82_gp069 [Gordonia phage Ronaldo]AXN53631.1 hypothetical protein SEA_RONALDO_69 [Gordonia phage Ronaldo]QDH48408.1 hypothetical protein SEA_ZIKO_69 [Gordonia phage Ziko]QHB38185.1 hypothetical protein SEA_VOLT_69 [Gordonia phage Volt]